MRPVSPQEQFSSELHRDQGLITTLPVRITSYCKDCRARQLPHAAAMQPVDVGQPPSCGNNLSIGPDHLLLVAFRESPMITRVGNSRSRGDLCQDSEALVARALVYLRTNLNRCTHTAGDGSRASPEHHSRAFCVTAGRVPSEPVRSVVRSSGAPCAQSRSLAGDRTSESAHARGPRRPVRSCCHMAVRPAEKIRQRLPDRPRTGQKATPQRCTGSRP